MNNCLAADIYTAPVARALLERTTRDFVLVPVRALLQWCTSRDSNPGPAD